MEIESQFQKGNDVISPKSTSSLAKQLQMKSPRSTAADALEEAQQRIAQLLQHPDDLNTKLEQLRSKFSSEKSAVDSVLKHSVQTQLDDTREGLKLLWQAGGLVGAVTSNLKNVRGSCEDTKSDIADYPRIKMISQTHLNFSNTQEIVAQFQGLQRDVERLGVLLSRDSRDLLGAAPNLLVIHQDLFRLMDFRDVTVQRARLQGPSVLTIVNKYFGRLNVLVGEFESYLFRLAANLFQLISENQGNVIVRLCKIVEVEEKADELVLNNQVIRSSNPALSESTEWRVLAVNPRTLRNYRNQLFNALMDKITRDFHERLSPHAGDVGTSLQVCNFVFDDLVVVFDEIGPRFPPKYNIFDFYVIQYHRQVYDFLNSLTSSTSVSSEGKGEDGSSKLDGGSILAITSWVRDYYRIMAERFAVSEDLLEPRLLDDKEDELIADYIQLIKRKLLEWVDRLLSGESTEFLERDKPPGLDGEGRYCSDATVIFFQMVNQQIDVAIDSARGGRLLLDVANECFEIMKYFQGKQLQMISDEESRFLNGDVIAGGFPEYVITISNNHLKGTEYVEVLQKRLENSLDEIYRADASRGANECLDGFMKVAKKGYACLVNIVFKDLSPAFASLFSPNWYNGDHIMPSIVQTLDDYLLDFQKHMAEYLFSKFTTDCMERFLVSYLVAVRSKQAKFRSNSFSEIAKNDLSLSIEFWSEYKTQKRVKQNFDLIDKIIALIDSSESMLFLSWYSLWKSYSDVPMAFVEELLYKRDDLDRTVIKEAITDCKDKARELNVEATPGIFSKAFPSK